MTDIVEIDRKKAFELIDKLARFIVERRLGVVAILTIESLKPLSGISSQALYAISPFIEIFFRQQDIQELAVLLDNREYVDLLVKRIDELDEEFYRDERKKNRLNRKRKQKLRKERLRKLMKKIKILKK